LFKSFIDSIGYLLDNPELADENLVLNKLKELLLLLSKTEQAKSINDFIASLFVPYEYNYNDIIQKNILSNLSIDDFAKLTNSSVATFKRKFAELYNDTPAKYLLTKRLEKSTQLLQVKSKPIADIAYECGFENVSNFNKVFKKHFSKTPSEFRLS
jgi:AraC family transcriptional regulator, exoenzyme S synthesis regulatory protein ExsA